MQILEGGGVQLNQFDLGDPVRLMKFLVVLRDRFRCVHCDKSLTSPDRCTDHVLPRNQLGPTIPENLVASCGDCNQIKWGQIPSRVSLRRIILITEENSRILHNETGVLVPPVKEIIGLHERVLWLNPPICSKCNRQLILRYSSDCSDFFWGCSSPCKYAKQVQEQAVWDRIRTFYPDYLRL